MFADLNDQEKFEKKLKELQIRNESMDQGIKELLSGLNVTPEQLTTFIKNQDNFSVENWRELQGQKQKLDEKLQRELSNIRDPKKAEKTYKDLRVGMDWLFVK